MLVIFDFDGTLYQAKPVILRAVSEYAQKTGFPEPEEGAVLRLARRGTSELIRGMIPAVMDLDEQIAMYRTILQRVIRGQGKLYPGIYDVLESLYNTGAEITVCSVSDEDYIDNALDATGIRRFIRGRYSAAGSKKKSEVIAQLLTNHKKPAVVIGDTHGDIEAAAENGLPSIAVMYGYGNKDLLSGADCIVQTPEEIPNAVEEIKYRYKIR